jgi:hypothetical protein
MRSTNIVLFLLLLNLFAGVMGAAGLVDVEVEVPGGDQIELVENTSVVERSQDQPSADEVTGGFLDAGRFIREMRIILGTGPAMLATLGVPRILTDGLFVVLGFVLIYDAFEAFTGREMS